MKLAVLALVLAACSERTAPADPVEVSDPARISSAITAPYDLQLRAAAAYPGSTWTVTVSGATPGARVVLAGSAGGADQGMCPAAWAGVCMDIGGRVRLHGDTHADGGGVATFTLHVPAVLPDGARHWFQAVEPAGPSTRTSNPFGVEGGDVDADGIADDVDPCVGLADVCPCTPPPNGEIFIYSMGFAGGDQHGRRGLSAWARTTIPDALPGNGTTRTYDATALASLWGDSVADLPGNHCFWPDATVLGVLPDGTLTILADDWADFVSGDLDRTLGSALGYASYEYVWTGSDVDGEATGYDCGGWTSDWRFDATISSRSDDTVDWLEEVGYRADCGAGYRWLGVAWCVEGDCALP